MSLADKATRRRFLAPFAGQGLDPPPIWLMRQAGRYLPEYRAVRAKAGSFLKLCYTPALAAEVTLQPIRRYGFDAAILFSDILVVPDALGQNVNFVEGEGPRLEPVRTAGELARLDKSATRAKYEIVCETRVQSLADQLRPHIRAATRRQRRHARHHLRQRRPQRRQHAGGERVDRAIARRQRVPGALQIGDPGS